MARLSYLKFLGQQSAGKWVEFHYQWGGGKYGGYLAANPPYSLLQFTASNLHDNCGAIIHYERRCANHGVHSDPA